MDAALGVLKDTLEQTLATVNQEREALQRERETMLAEKDALEKEKVDLLVDKEMVFEELREVERLRQELEDEKTTMAAVCGGDKKVFNISLGGERVITVKRALFTQFDGTMLATWFSGRNDNLLDRDDHGNVLLDYSPPVVMPLIEVLRLHRDQPCGKKELRDSLHVAPEHQAGFDAMVKFFDLTFLASSFTFTFSEIKENVPIGDLVGWTQILCAGYNQITTLEDFVPPPELQGGSLLIGARRAGSTVLTLAAMGNADAITEKTSGDHTHLHNGVYWYFCPNRSFGFAPVSTVKLNAADVLEGTRRVSWHLNGGGGFRVGDNDDVDGNSWEKLIFATHNKLFG